MAGYLGIIHSRIANVAGHTMIQYFVYRVMANYTYKYDYEFGVIVPCLGYTSTILFVTINHFILWHYYDPV